MTLHLSYREPVLPEVRTPTRATPEMQSGADLSALFAAIWRGRVLILGLVMIALAAGIYYATILATPMYRSTVVVILETEQDQIVDVQSVVGGLTGETSELNSEVEVLRARTLAGRVVDELDLMEDPEFNPALRPAGRFDRIKSAVRTLLPSSESAFDLNPEEKATRDRDIVISNLLSAITVRNVPLSLVFRVTAETEDPRKSALIADTLVDIYIQSQIEVKRQATEQATFWLSDRVGELQQKLEAAESRVSEFKAATDLISAESLSGLERQIKDLRNRIATTEDTRLAIEARIGALLSADKRELRANIADDPQLSRFLARADVDRAMTAAFDARFDLLVEQERLDLGEVERQLAALHQSEAELSARIGRQGADLIRLQQLTREAEAARVLYEHFLARLNETVAQQGIQQADSRVLSGAVVPMGPATPRNSLILAMAGMFGLLGGIGIVLLRELRNKSIRSAPELEDLTGYPVLGQVPLIPIVNRRKVLRYLSDKPTSAAAEAVRNLRTSLMLSNGRHPPQVILSTSSLPGEGKTTNALALAQNVLGLGKSVLLIEADIRRRSLNEFFGDLPQRGLVSVLTGRLTLNEAVHRPTGFDADILAGERSIVSAADLFASDSFAAMIKEARALYDVVIVDTPPVLLVPDARIMAEEADAILFNVRWDATGRHQVEEALRLMRMPRQPATGMVLSQVNPRGLARYGHGTPETYGWRYYQN